MKKHLIGIMSDTGASVFITVYGDTPSRPFIIANNLWNYKTPWTAARQLESVAKAMEKNGQRVRRFYGTPHDMPTRGNAYNVAMTLNDYKQQEVK